MVRIVLDPGHGGTDPGAVGNGLQEKDIVLELALRTGKLLELRGAKVHYTRTTDVFIPLETRARIANELKADYFMSFHINSSGAPNTATGFETFIFTESGATTAAYQNVIHKAIYKVVKEFELPDRGQHKANFAVLRRTSMPAILNEYGFINNSKDASLLKNADFLKKLAEATVQGIAQAFGLPTATCKDDITGHWAEKQIRKVLVEGKMAGFPDGTFRPNEPITRAQLAALIAEGKL